MHPDEIDDLEEKKLCHRCVREEYLSSEIRSHGRRRKCSYCGKVRHCYPIGKMAERIYEAFGQHYMRTSDQPTSWQSMMLKDEESDYYWERDGVPVVNAIMNAAEIPETAAQDIQQILDGQYGDFEAAKIGEETEFSADSYHEEKGPNDAVWQEEWQSFERSLKRSARFFSRTSAKHLHSIFDGIDTMKSRDGRPLVVDAGPGTILRALYRARTFQSDDSLTTALCRPDQHLGSPPSMRASAGRMNALGISVFYGANDPKVALAEVRPPVGSQVAVARFDITRPIRLLDLTALGEVSSVGSVFDPGLGARLERAMFLRSLSQRITKPVMPDDEAFEYLPTQAIADFLATEVDMPLDGIIFPSVQAAGNALNVVLFHKAARVQSLEVPAGTEISARLRQIYEDGWEAEYTVIEEAPVKEATPPADRAKVGGSPRLTALAAMPPEHDSDCRETTLKIAVDSLKIHIVRQIEFRTDEHNVQRHRWEKDELLF
jgi:hypothetical protein